MVWFGKTGEGQPLGAAEAHVPPVVRVDQLEDQRGFRRSIRHGGGGEGGRKYFHRHPGHLR